MIIMWHYLLLLSNNKEIFFSHCTNGYILIQRRETSASINNIRYHQFSMNYFRIYWLTYAYRWRTAVKHVLACNATLHWEEVVSMLLSVLSKIILQSIKSYQLYFHLLLSNLTYHYVIKVILD